MTSQKKQSISRNYTNREFAQTIANLWPLEDKELDKFKIINKRRTLGVSSGDLLSGNYFFKSYGCDLRLIYFIDNFSNRQFIEEVLAA